jgi:hypothetical protein
MAGDTQKKEGRRNIRQPSTILQSLLQPSGRRIRRRPHIRRDHRLRRHQCVALADALH